MEKEEKCWKISSEKLTLIESESDSLKSFIKMGKFYIQ